MADRNLMQEFQTIIEEYKASPFGFRLRKTGTFLKLVESNGLLYLDNENLFKIVNELLGPNIPDEMQEYIEKIVFSETITIEKHNVQHTLILTCIQFIDYGFFTKCIDWMKENIQVRKISQFEELFTNPLDSICSTQKSIFSSSNLNGSSNVDKMFPFKEIWKFNDFGIPQQIKSEHEYTRKPHDFLLGKPRGKHMNLNNESLKERPYVCEVPFCDRAFKRFEHLKRHMKMHTGDRPYKCTFPGCNKSFSRSDNLNQHQKTHSVNANTIYFNTFGKTI